MLANAWNACNKAEKATKARSHFGIIVAAIARCLAFIRRINAARTRYFYRGRALASAESCRPGQSPVPQSPVHPGNWLRGSLHSLIRSNLPYFLEHVIRHACPTRQAPRSHFAKIKDAVCETDRSVHPSVRCCRSFAKPRRGTILRLPKLLFGWRSSVSIKRPPRG